MMALTHVVLGAAIGEQIVNPAIAFGAGITSHLIADKIPHFWPNSKKGQDVIMWVDIVLIAASFIVYLLFPFPNKAGIFWGALGGGIVDFVLVLLPKFSPTFMNHPIRVWHEKRQYHFTNPVYLFTDIGLTIIGMILLVVR